uniref:uncharacterized protein LOC120334177 isoform X1 n=1 Tax=Styela clava TaxID=7725 RepID=UPI00193A3F45|nr:uncharacterized protein LOC120334177 isoform X1 [Styela clava]
MADVMQHPTNVEWKDGKSPLSYWNVPQAVKTTQTLSDSMTSGYGMPSPPPTPSIQQMYDPAEVKQLPGKGAKGKGQFVDWGTKLYQLELELSYKNNEIVLLNKKLKKYTDELYPGGNTSKKSVITSLQNQNDVMKKKLEVKEGQLRREQTRCKGLQHELAEVKKHNLELRRRHLVNEKGVQTLPINNKDTQASSPPKKPRTRTVMTQCSPTVLKVTNSTKVTSLPQPSDSKVSGTQRKLYRKARDHYTNSYSTSTFSPGSSASSITNNFKTKVSPRSPAQNVTVENKVKLEVVPDHSNTTSTSVVPFSTASSLSPKTSMFIPSKPGVKFATSMTIKESAEAARKVRDPLEMSITQEFDKENSVRTIVQSNRDFEIKEKPALISANGQVVSGIEHTARPECLKPKSYTTDGDSGISSACDVSDAGSPSFFRGTRTDMNSPQSSRISYKQILDGSVPEPNAEHPQGRVYERHLQEYMQRPYPASTHPMPPSYRNLQTRPQSPYNSTSWDIYNRNYQKSDQTSMIPYYLFRRSNENAERNRSNEKPIFVHVSEIMMNR